MDGRIIELFKFIIVGGVSTLLLYGIYYILLHFINANYSYAIGYLSSMTINYLLTAKFTFNTKVSKRNGLGFVLCHIINCLLQLITLNIVIGIGFSEEKAPIPVFAICVPINFILVRLVMKRF